MGYTAHQPGINFMSYAALFGRLALACFLGSAAVKYGRISRQCKGNEFVGLIDSVCNLSLNDFLSRKTFHRNFRISGYDYAKCIFNIIRGQCILCTRRSSGFDFNRDSCFGCCLLQSFCCHIGVCNTGRTACYRYQIPASCINYHICKTFIHALLFFVRLVNDCEEFIHVFSIDQVVSKILIHQHHG